MLAGWPLQLLDIRDTQLGQIAQRDGITGLKSQGRLIASCRVIRASQQMQYGPQISVSMGIAWSQGHSLKQRCTLFKEQFIWKLLFDQWTHLSVPHFRIHFSVQQSHCGGGGHHQSIIVGRQFRGSAMVDGGLMMSRLQREEFGCGRNTKTITILRSRYIYITILHIVKRQRTN